MALKVFVDRSPWRRRQKSFVLQRQKTRQKASATAPSFPGHKKPRDSRPSWQWTPPCNFSKHCHSRSSQYLPVLPLCTGAALAFYSIPVGKTQPIVQNAAHFCTMATAKSELSGETRTAHTKTKNLLAFRAGFVGLVIV
jgi:hypothetical protein